MPVFKNVLEVFQKEQPEDDVLVFRCLHRAPQPVGRQPEPVGEFEVAVYVFRRVFLLRHNPPLPDKPGFYRTASF